MQQSASFLRRLAGAWIAGLLLFTGINACAQVWMPRNMPVPGGVAVVRVAAANAAPLEVSYGSARVLTVRHEDGVYAVVGLGLDTQPGSKRLQVTTGEGVLRPVPDVVFEVRPKAYPAQHLKIARRYLDPSAAEVARIERDQAAIVRARNHWSGEQPASLVLDLPARGRLSARFGLRRILNGEERSPHGGLDVAVGTGTPIRAAAAGRVVNTGDYFYSGNTVFVDHGQGFITVYLHFSRIDVKEGDTVERGAVLGLAGATGQVTGPHLHWAVLLNGVYVDPEFFLKSGR